MKENAEKITPELLRHSCLVFYPRTANEAILIQQKLFDMGADWAGGGGQNLAHVEESVNGGMVVQFGKIYYNPSESPTYRRARIEQFDDEYLTPEQHFLKAQFDKINARLDAMEKKVDELRDAMLPKDMGKPVLKKPIL